MGVKIKVYELQCKYTIPENDLRLVLGIWPLVRELLGAGVYKRKCSIRKDLDSLVEGVINAESSQDGKDAMNEFLLRLRTQSSGGATADLQIDIASYRKDFM
jgi:hypothetical protein